MKVVRLPKLEINKEIRVGGNGHKLSLRQKIARWLLRNAHIDELHIGAHTITIDGDVIKMNALASDPATPAEGWIWYLAGAAHKPRHYDGTSNKDIGEGAAPGAHAASHQNGGADEISVAGLSGELADPQPPKAHAADHKSGGSDEIDLDELGAPTGAVDMNSQRLTSLAAPTAQNDAVRADANLRAPDSSKLEGSTKAEVQNHAPASHNHAGDTLSPAQINVGDITFKNGFRLTEDKKYGVVLVSSSGKKYRMVEC